MSRKNTALRLELLNPASNVVSRKVCAKWSRAQLWRHSAADAHTKGDTGFFVQGDNVLFSGDVVMNNSFALARA
jgi:hypothetical protein